MGHSHGRICGRPWPTTPDATPPRRTAGPLIAALDDVLKWMREALWSLDALLVVMAYTALLLTLPNVSRRRRSRTLTPPDL